MIRKIALFCLLAVCGLGCANGQTVPAETTSPVNLIPRPTSVQMGEGEFTIAGSLRVSYNLQDPEQETIVRMLSERIAQLTLGPNAQLFPGLNVVADAKSPNLWIEKIDTKENLKLGTEGYYLQVNDQGVRITAPANAGLFYGVQTLLQLIESGPVGLSLTHETLPQNKTTAVVSAVFLPQLFITDTPRFGWRGLMLDVSRHFFTKEEVMAYIDQMAAYKYNTFHWHLTDDQGWRIEIKSLPRLTEVSAWRAPRVGDWWSVEPQKQGEKSTYGGFYTQAEIKEVIEYARQRYVTVIPEIDVPGHSLAALVAYPELACNGAVVPPFVNVGNKFYGKDVNTLCVANPKSVEFMSKVVKEVAALFPAPYIHVGGDECFKGFWKKCPRCQALIASKGLKNEDGLQSYFIKGMETLLAKHNKRLIGWDEILEGGLAPNATVMSWRGMQGGIDAAKQGHHVIMTPTQHCYLDLYQGDPSVEPNTYSMCRLRDSYAFEPLPEGIDPNLILGGQGNLWAESVPTFRHAQYMIWPRALAVSEVLWSPREGKNWDDFVRRTEWHLRLLEARGINHANSIYDPIVSTRLDEAGVLRIKLSSEINDPAIELRYTFDNTNPDLYSPLYSEELTIPLNASRLKVAAFRSRKPIGQTITLTPQELRSRIPRKRVVGNL